MIIKKSGVTLIEIIFFVFCLLFYVGGLNNESLKALEYEKIARILRSPTNSKNTKSYIETQNKDKNNTSNTYENNINLIASNQTSSIEPKQKHYNILIVGLDSVEGTFRTDTIILAGISLKHNRISLLSIPRDTRVVINNSNRKINEVLPRFGTLGLRSTIENLLDIKIDYYVEISYNSFVKIVDLLGGIRIYIDQPMHYDDFSGKLHIHFNKGWHDLDGVKALNYVRYRADAQADLGRIKRQQKFISLLLEKFKSPSTIIKLPIIINEVYKYIKTDITLQEIINIIQFIDFNKIDIKTFSIPGEAAYIDKVSFYITNATESKKISSLYFSFNEHIELSKDFTLHISNTATSTSNLVSTTTTTNLNLNYLESNENIKLNFVSNNESDNTNLQETPNNTSKNIIYKPNTIEDQTASNTNSKMNISNYDLNNYNIITSNQYDTNSYNPISTSTNKFLQNNNN